MTIFLAIIILIILILAHELGHFFFAKLFKVRVHEFGIFLPPRLLSFKIGETIYSLNAIPLGGFNRLAGEVDPNELDNEPESIEETAETLREHSVGDFVRSILWLPPAGNEDYAPSKTGQYFNVFNPLMWVSDESTGTPVKPQKPKIITGTLAGKSHLVRIIVLSAGSVMNLLLPLLLFIIALMIPHQAEIGDPLNGKGDVLAASVQADSPAALAGIKDGDIILTVNGQKMSNIIEYQNIVNQNPGQLITVTIKHPDGTTTTVTMTPRVNPPAGQGKTGIALTVVEMESLSFWQAIPGGAVRYWDILVAFKDSIAMTINGSLPFQPTGVVGITQVVGEVARTGAANVLQLAAFISLNLGILNIFPVPSLDGGRIVFVLLEWVRRGKRISPKTERLIHGIGFALLMALIIFVTYHDIVRLIGGKSPLQP